jgi:DNA-binding transcriptional LysR family regulator
MKIELRDLELLAALAKHKHFTRAAEACGISQPALSSRIANLEAVMGMALVRRGSRFGGFTEEGEILLKWARRILAENDAMLQEMTNAKGVIAGRVVMGVIPTALGQATRLAAAVKRQHPRVVPEIHSASAAEIEAGLGSGSFDVGVSYLEDTAPNRYAALPIYRESYVVVIPASMAPAGRGAITWREVASYPLALLTPNMKNRQIIDGVFRDVGATPRAVFETDDLSALFTFVAESESVTIAPANAADTRFFDQRFTTLPLVEPEIRRTIAILTPDTGFEPPAVTATLRVASAMPRTPS